MNLLDQGKLERYLEVHPQASLQEYKDYIDQCQKNEKDAKDATYKEYRDYFEKTYVGKYVMVNHNGKSFSFAGPVTSDWFDKSGICFSTTRNKFERVDVYVGDGEYRVEFVTRDDAVFNAYWLYYPMRIPGKWFDCTSKETRVFSEEEFRAFVKEAKACAEIVAALKDKLVNNVKFE